MTVPDARICFSKKDDRNMYQSIGSCLWLSVCCRSLYLARCGETTLVLFVLSSFMQRTPFALVTQHITTTCLLLNADSTVCLPVCLIVNTVLRSRAFQHRLAPGVEILGDTTNQQNTGYHTGSSRVRRVLSIADNPTRSSTTEPALIPTLRFKLTLSHTIDQF